MNKSSKTPLILIAAFLFVGVIAGYMWFNQAPTPVVAAVKPKPAPAKSAPLLELPPPPPAEVPPAEEPPAPPQGRQGFGNFDPAQRQQFMQQITDQMYGDLFTTMNLTADQQARVNDLMGQRMQAVGQAMREMFQNGPPANFDPQAIQQQIQAAQEPVNAQIQATVGDANYQQIQARDQQLQQQFGGGRGFGGGG